MLALGSGALLAGYGIIVATAWARFGGRREVILDEIEIVSISFVSNFHLILLHIMMLLVTKLTPGKECSVQHYLIFTL